MSEAYTTTYKKYTYKNTMQIYTTWMQKMLHITMKLVKLQTIKIYTNSLSLITSVLIVCSELHVYNFLQYLSERKAINFQRN